MKHLDLFSGIGGFALAAEMVWPNVEHIFCDNDPFSQAILKKHWPNSKIYGDIRGLTANAELGYIQSKKEIQTRRTSSINGDKQRGLGRIPSHRRHRIDILTGGFPCQPFSQAGRRRGTEDDRHLWPEMLRVIREFHPTRGWRNAALKGAGNAIVPQVAAQIMRAIKEVYPKMV